MLQRQLKCKPVLCNNDCSSYHESKMSKANQKSEIPETVFFVRAMVQQLPQPRPTGRQQKHQSPAPQEQKDMTTAEQTQEALLYVNDLLHMVWSTWHICQG